ncbi:helix-turn-helix domain-containing protein [Flavobacteriaceae bacterium GSB9]|nr:helix-turn-helix domain-containing protein [Flavobacteriaceae bacterium GSB9]
MDTQISMDQVFLSNLDEILEANYQDEHFGVRELSSLAGVSRSKLHRKLRELKEQTASEYIKAYRLQKAYLLLKNNVSSVSEIAYSVGFNSPSYFTKCFHKRYKCAPSEVKQKPELGDGVKEHHGKARQLSSFSLKKSAFLGVLVLLLGMGAYIVGDLASERKANRKVTLAVLPFKTLSDNPSDQYFADGVMDVILSSLSGIENFNVISRTTMEQYRKNSKTTPEIAKELGITHMLEASVQKQTDEVRIVVKLIDAKNDVHIWSDHYERQYKDIFSMQSEVAREIVDQLAVTLTPADEKKIAETPTKNVEAYNLYLKGRFFWDRRTEADLKRSIKYFEEAIALDSLYALAYAGLGDAYQVMGWWGWYPREEGFEKAKVYAEKALLINENISLAHTVLGINFFNEWDYKRAENKFKLALNLEPTNSRAHQFYAELLDLLGRKKEAREHIDLAIKYNPNAPILYSSSGTIYYNNGEFENALKESAKAREFNEKRGLKNIFLSNVRLHEYDKAVEALKAKNSKFKDAPGEIDAIYKAQGIEGVLEWYINQFSESGKNGCIGKAELCMFIGDTERALDLLEKSYEKKEYYFPKIKSDIDFEPLKTHPRFIVLVNKLNME